MLHVKGPLPSTPDGVVVCSPEASSNCDLNMPSDLSPIPLSGQTALKDTLGT